MHAFIERRRNQIETRPFQKDEKDRLTTKGSSPNYFWLIAEFSRFILDELVEIRNVNVTFHRKKVKPGRSRNNVNNFPLSHGKYPLNHKE